MMADGRAWLLLIVCLGLLQLCQMSSATGVGLGAGGAFSAARCVAETRAYDKREGDRILCSSLAQVYQQLKETERGEHKWLGTAKAQDMAVTKTTAALRSRTEYLEASLKKDRTVEASNEELSLTLEELQGIYEQQKKHLASVEEKMAAEKQQVKAAKAKQAKAEKEEFLAVQQQRFAEARLKLVEDELSGVAQNCTSNLQIEMQAAEAAKVALEKQRKGEKGRCDNRIRRSMSLLSKSEDLHASKQRRLERRADAAEAEVAELKKALAEEQEKRLAAEKDMSTMKSEMLEAAKAVNAAVNAKADQEKAFQQSLLQEKSVCEGRVRDALAQSQQQDSIEQQERR